MYDFDLYEPESLSDALNLLQEIPDGRIAAGGTDLMVLIKDLLLRPSTLISLAKVEELVGIETNDETWMVGPMTPLWHLERSGALRLTYPALHQAILELAVPPIRNQATLGGNLCLDTKCIYYNQSHVWERSLPHCFKAGGDMCHVAPAGKRCVGALAAEAVGPLWVYGAELTLASRRGRRRVPLKAFYTGAGLTPHDLAKGEMLTAIHLPIPQPRFGAAYCRFAYRKALAFSEFNLSAAIRLDDRGRIASATLVVGAIAPAPVELKESLSSLQGQYPSVALWAKAARKATKEAVRLARSPRLTPYLQEVLSVYAERLFKETLDLAKANRM
jgi:4-hydroxybenzoyl-CoA reductase subunit beta